MTEQDLEKYQKLLTKIGKKIRRTLDVDTIWQQTVDTLGLDLNVSHCIICSYKKGSKKLHVVAEYRQKPVKPLLGNLLWLADEPGLEKALTSLQPVIVEQPAENGQSKGKNQLIVAISYQNIPKGILILYGEEYRHWTDAEIEVVEEVADQVGACVAYLNLQEELEETRKQAQEATRLKQEFLTTISHELRTPLNGTIGFLKLILDDLVDEPDEQREFTEEAYRSSLHLLNIINDILDIAKIEAKQIKLALGAVNLEEMLSEVEKITKPQIDKKNLSFQIRLPKNNDKIVVYGNYSRLLQVMLNLVGNAIKFTNEGGITITAEVLKTKVLFQNQELPGMVKIRVDDTGIGVPLDKLDKIFGIFNKADGSTTTPVGGTGLGLAISQELVEAMGGAVEFFSMGENLGSTVTFTVPLYQDNLIGSNECIGIPKNN
ncbi:MAG TPA: GAF domain-containing sensor histidine kinase [Leptolyngbyaceae cyanobacterium]